MQLELSNLPNASHQFVQPSGRSFQIPCTTRSSYSTWKLSQFQCQNNYSNQPRSIRAYTFDSQGFHETKLAECFTYKNYKKTNYKAYSFDSESLYWLLRDSREIIWKRDFELLAPTSSYLAARRLRTNSTGHTFCLYLSARDFRPLGGRQKANVLVF